MDAITKYILAEDTSNDMDKKLDSTEKDVKQIPNDSENNLRKMKSMQMEILNSFMFEK